MRPQIVIFTGGRGVGKTTWILELSQEWKATNQAHFGIAEPKIFNEGELVGIAALDLATNKQAELALKDNQLGMRIGPWRFLPDGITFANECCRPGLHKGIAIIDEIGPLELCGKGLTVPWHTLQNGGYPQAIVVVRSDLLEITKANIPGNQKIMKWPEESDVSRLKEMKKQIAQHFILAGY